MPSNPRRMFAAAVYAVLLMAFGAANAARSAQSPQRADAQALESWVKHLLGFAPPCSLIWCDFYRDGGTMGGAFLCSGGDTVPFAWGEVTSVTVPSYEVLQDTARRHAWVDSISQASAYRVVPILVGVDYWRKKGGRRLAVGSVPESLFIQIMSANAAPETPRDKPRGEFTSRQHLRDLLNRVLAQRAKVVQAATKPR